MATISNATTGNDILVPTNDDVTYRGLSGDTLTSYHQQLLLTQKSVSLILLALTEFN